MGRDLLWEIAHILMEAEKSPDLQSTSLLASLTVVGQARSPQNQGTNSQEWEKTDVSN